MNPLKRLLGQTAIYGLSSIVGRLLNYLLVPLYTRVFLPNEYGVVVELYAYVGFFNVILTYGMETSFFRFSEKYKDYLRVFSTAISSLFISTSVFLLIGLLLSGGIANYLQYQNNVEYIVWFVLIISLDTLAAIPFAKLRLQNKAIKFAVIKFINIGINILLNLFFLILCPLILKQNPDSFFNLIYSERVGVGYIFISNLIASAITLFLLIPEFKGFNFSFENTLLKEMLRYSWPLLIAGLAGMVNETLDRILLKAFIVIPDYVADSHKYIMGQIGIYGANYKISIFMTLFIQAFRYTAEPFFFSQMSKSDSKKIYADVMKFFVLFCLLVFLSINLFIDIVKLFIDSNYYSGLHIVPILLGANLFLGIIFNLSIWYKLTNRTKFGALIAIFGAIITIVLNIILIPYIGYTGSAVATLVCYFLMAVLSYILSKKYFPIPYNLKRIFGYSLLALILYFTDLMISIDILVLKYALKLTYISVFVLIAIRFEGISLIKQLRK